jgi:histidinol phosphatase-like PHP family hydrolase
MRSVTTLLPGLVSLPSSVARSGGTPKPPPVLMVHAHSRCSDGVYDMKTLADRMRRAGADFVVITDHAEVITEKVGDPKDIVGRFVPSRTRRELLKSLDAVPTRLRARSALAGKPEGVAAWKQEFRNAGERLIPGMEVGLVRRSQKEPRNRRAHLLFVGGSVEDNTYDRVVDLTDSSEPITVIGAQRTLMDLLALARRKQAVVIGAHPELINFTLPDSFRGPCAHCCVMGLEFFTSGISLKSVADAFKALQHLPQPALVTAGVDYHGGTLAPLTPLDRYTVLSRPAENVGDVMLALRGGTCYAAKGKARIGRGAGVIGGQIDPHGVFEVVFEALKGGVAKRQASILCVPEKGTAKLIEAPITKGVLQIADPAATLPPVMSGGGWVYLAAPRDDIQIVTSAIRVPGY